MSAAARCGLSVVHPLQLGDPAELERAAALVADGPAERLWTGQSMRGESHLAFAHLAGSGTRIPMGTSVTLTPLRHPVEAALQARALARMSGCSYVAGYGVAEPRFQTALRGEKYLSPRTAAADYVRAVRALLAGEKVDLPSDYTPTHLPLPELEHPEVQIGLGVLRRGMARTAGEVADVAVTWLTPPAYLRDVIVPALEEGAQAAGRPRPRVVAVVHTGLIEQRQAEVLVGVSRVHLTAPHYCDMLRRSGLTGDPDDPLATAHGLVEAKGVAFGDLGHVASVLDAYADAGADEVALNPLGGFLTNGPDEAWRAMETILSALGSAARA